jgi:hypothetical protein
LWRWNGTSWKALWQDYANPDMAAAFPSVKAISPSNVWAVGSLYYTGGVYGFSVHWNGNVATRGGGPFAHSVDEYYNHNWGVGASSATNVWEVGDGTWYPIDSEGRAGATAAVFNGSTWHDAFPTAYSAWYDPWHKFTSVAPASTTAVWAVGSRGGPNDGSYNLMAFWNGRTWTEYGGPNPNAASALESVSRIPGSTTKYWAVGHTGGYPLAGTSKTMILRCC